jgi:NTP pyrophosphatase (non-canonical NTP hydrolase)
MNLTSEQEELLKQALSKWGHEAQIKMAVEECGEFLSAIMKSYRGRVTNDDIVDEIADNILMQEQMAMIFGKEKVIERIKFKMDRVKTRLNA